jgi:hypothetical protein
MELLITLLIYILVFAVIFYAVIEIVKAMNVPAQFANVIKVIILALFVILIISLFLGVNLPKLRL